MFIQLLIATLFLLAFTSQTSAQTRHWTDLGTHKIQRLELDGAVGIEDVVNAGLVTPVDIALNLATGTMFWTELAPGEYAIFRAKLDGTGRQGVAVSSGGSPSGIAVDSAGGKLYWTAPTCNCSLLV